MAYLGKTPTPVPLTADDIEDGIIDTAELADDAVTAAKLDDTASFTVGGLSTAGTVNAGTFTGGNVTNWDTAYGWGDHGAQGYATTSYVDTEVAGLVDAAPAALDTLNELAAALGDDANFSTTVTNSIATKVSKSGDTMTGALNFGDNVKAQFGAGSDLQIYHDGVASYISDQGIGNLILLAGNFRVNNPASNENMIVANNNADVSLYYDNAKKIETTSTGVTVTGTVTADGVSLGDSDFISLGNSNDFYIYHNGTDSYIDDAGTGNLRIRGSQILLEKYTGEQMVTALADGAVELYHDNSKKFETTSTGIDVTGTATMDGLALGDAQAANFGAASDLRIYHDGGNSYIQDVGAGNLNIQTNGVGVVIEHTDGTNLAVFNSGDGTANLYHSGSLKLATTSDGVDITGEIYANRGRGATHTTSLNGTQTPNFTTYTNFVWTLTGNVTLSNPSTEAVGQSGVFVFIHSGAARTVSLGSEYKTVGGAGLTLSGAANAIDVIPYFVRATNNIVLGQPLLAVS